MDTRYADFHRRSLEDRDGFWAEQARLVDWERPFAEVCDDSKPPFTRWFVGGRTNLCFNALDRHVDAHGDRTALIWVSTEVDKEIVYTTRGLHREVQHMAAALIDLGVVPGDRVIVYLPMIPEAVFAMLACARIGAIHSVVFGGFGSRSLAARIDDAQPSVIVSADAGSRGGTVIPYKPLLDEAIHLADWKPRRVLLVDRGLAPMAKVESRDADYAELRRLHEDAEVRCEAVDSTHTSYTLYTSGTAGKPKGVQRDTGGYAVALAASMRHVFDGRAGETFFCTSDVGWVVGHSYIVYAPLIAGMATLLYEGLPARPDPGVWWRLVEQHRVTVMFSSPTAMRVLKRHGREAFPRRDLSSLRALFLAGEPLDEPTGAWLSEALGKPVIDNYWQTETGWPVISMPNGVESLPAKPGAAGVPLYGYDVRLFDAASGEELTEPNARGLLGIAGPLPPGFMQTIWRDDQRFVETYWKAVPGRDVYSTFDWAVRDADGYFFLLGRSDDVINVAGHRLGTREIEASIVAEPEVAEAAVIGCADALKGEIAIAFVVPKVAGMLADPQRAAQLEAAIGRRVADEVGPFARPAQVRFVSALPKTRSGKILRRALKAISEGRDPGDLTTIEDESALAAIVAPEASAAPSAWAASPASPASAASPDAAGGG